MDVHYLAPYLINNSFDSTDPNHKPYERFRRLIYKCKEVTVLPDELSSAGFMKFVAKEFLQAAESSYSLVPVPSSSTHVGNTEHNTATKRLGTFLGNHFGSNFSCDEHLVWKEAQPKTRGMSKDQRAEARTPEKLHLLKPLSHNDVILIDDVITTGATIGACAAFLQQKGYRVRCLALGYAINLAYEAIEADLPGVKQISLPALQ